MKPNWPDIKDKNAWLAIEVMGWHKIVGSADWYDNQEEATGYHCYLPNISTAPKIFRPTTDHNHMALVRGKMLDDGWNCIYHWDRNILAPCNEHYWVFAKNIGVHKKYISGTAHHKTDELQAEGEAIFQALIKNEGAR